MKEPPIAQIEKAEGLNTYAARGSSSAPYVLQNALLHPGGWACAPRAVKLLSGVTHTVWAGRARDFYAETEAGIGLVVNGRVEASFAGTLSRAHTLGPNLVQTVDGYLSDSTITPLNQGPQFTAWDGIGAEPDGPYYKITSSPNHTLYRIFAVRGPDAVTPSSDLWVTELDIAGQISFGHLTQEIMVYARSAEGSNPFAYAGTNLDASGKLMSQFTPAVSTGGLNKAPPATDTMRFELGLAEYFNARVYVVPTTTLRFDPVKGVQNLQPPLNRIYFSEVAAQFSPTALPFFAEDYYFDVPFRVSGRIQGIKAVGRYLYVFGDNEVLLHTGTDDSTWQFEPLADSIGTIDPHSIQSMQGVVYYRSEGTVLAISGAQVSDIGLPVRDLITKLNPFTISSTVDFERNLYYLSDGVTTLCFNAGGGGWTTRQVDGPEQSMVYAGGEPLSLFKDEAGQPNLYSLDSPQLLPLKVELGPFGVLGWRQTWRGVGGAVDTDHEASAVVQTTGYDTDMEGAAVQTPSATQTRAAHEGLSVLNVSMGADTAQLVSLAIELTPDANTRRCILRPPIRIVGTGGTEAWA